jgi:nitroreductase
MSPEPPDALACLLSRRSVPALQLRAPGPSDAEIDLAVQAALSGPDHGALRPLRLLLIRGAARERLAELFVARTRARDAATPEAKLDKARRMPLCAPLVIAMGAAVRAAPKVPEIEQLFAAAAGAMNLLNAFHAQGYGAIWLTGGNAYDPAVSQALGFAAGERCLGFLYVGSRPEGFAPAPRRPGHEGIVREWGG